MVWLYFAKCEDGYMEIERATGFANGRFAVLKKTFISLVTAGVMALTAFAQAPAPGAAQKNWKDRAEYDL